MTSCSIRIPVLGCNLSFFLTVLAMAQAAGICSCLLLFVILSQLPSNVIGGEGELKREEKMPCNHNARAEEVSGCQKWCARPSQCPIALL